MTIEFFPEGSESISYIRAKTELEKAGFMSSIQGIHFEESQKDQVLEILKKVQCSCPYMIT